MKLIDSHSHIYTNDFKSDIDDVIANAKTAGVEKILLPNIDSQSIDDLHALVNRYPEYCIPMMGLHPTSVKENYQAELDICKMWLDKNQYCAIGEIGMDLYWDKSFANEQRKAFQIQIEWALEYQLPIAIHVREAFNETFDILEEYRNTNLHGVFHSFTGNQEQAERAINLGFLLGINGIVSFKNAGLDKTLEQIPLEKLILETDSPYLAPVPKRGKRNESAYLLYIANKLAEIYRTDVANIAEITSKNTELLFRL